MDDDAILGLYEAVGGYVLGNPATDNGCMLQAVCQYMVTTGLAEVTGTAGVRQASPPATSPSATTPTWSC